MVWQNNSCAIDIAIMIAAAMHNGRARASASITGRIRVVTRLTNDATRYTTDNAAIRREIVKNKNNIYCHDCRVTGSSYNGTIKNKKNKRKLPVKGVKLSLSRANPCKTGTVCCCFLDDCAYLHIFFKCV